MIRGIHHTAISTGDLDRALEFYRDLLGFEVAGGRAAGVRLVESTRLALLAVSLGGVHIALAAFVVDQGLNPGTSIEVLGVGKHGDRLVAIDGACIHLGIDIAEGIRMESR